MGRGREGGREGGKGEQIAALLTMQIAHLCVFFMEVNNLHGDIRGEGCNKLGDTELQC